MWVVTEGPANTEMLSQTPSPELATEAQHCLPDTHGRRMKASSGEERLGRGPYSHSPPPSCPVPWPQTLSWPVPGGYWDGRHPHRSPAPAGTSPSPERRQWRVSSPCCPDPVGDRTGVVGEALPQERGEAHNWALGSVRRASVLLPPVPSPFSGTSCAANVLGPLDESPPPRYPESSARRSSEV